MRDDIKDVRVAHEVLTKELGRPPTLHELALKMNATQHMIRCFVLDDGLPLSKLTPSERAQAGKKRREENARREAAEARARAKREKIELKEWHIEPLNRAKIKPAILHGERGMLPGREWDPGRILFAECAKCGRRILVRPRTHPWWVDRGEGQMSPACGGICAGMFVYTVWKMNM